MRWRTLLRRVGMSVLTVYVALSAMFVLVTVAPNTAVDGKVASASFASGGELNESELAELRETVLEARGLDRPVYVRYTDYLADMTMGRWGLSFALDAPVKALVLDRAERTLSYAIPGVILGAALGMAAGLVSAAGRERLSEYALRTVGYGLFGVPAFWLIAVVAGVLALPEVSSAVGDVPPLFWQRILPAAVLATTLVAGQLSFVRAEALEQVDRPYVLFLRAKGLSRLKVGWRIVRNAAVPLVTLFFTDLLAVFVITVYVVEAALGIPGLGDLTRIAARDRDMPLLLGTTLIFVLLGVGANLLQDVTYESLDPRTGEDA